MTTQHFFFKKCNTEIIFLKEKEGGKLLLGPEGAMGTAGIW
jgi:hypothetical protein